MVALFRKHQGMVEAMLSERESGGDVLDFVHFLGWEHKAMNMQSWRESQAEQPLYELRSICANQGHIVNSFPVQLLVLLARGLSLGCV